MKTSPSDFDIAVIGAGVIGAACAFRLAQSGRSVVLCDRDEPGRGCSFGNAGHIASEEIFPLPSIATLLAAPGYLLRKDAPLSIRPHYAAKIAPWLARFVWAARPGAFRRGTEALKSLQSRSRADFLRLAEDAGAAALCHADGNLMLVERAGSIGAVKREIAARVANGVEAKWLKPAAAYEILGRKSPAIAGAAYFSGAGHVDNPFAIVTAFAKAAADAGAEIRQAEIIGIARGADGYVIASPQGDMRANIVLIAAGAWSRPLVNALGFDIPLDTERGYHLMAEGSAATFALPVSSFERRVILTPMTQGVRITGAIEFGGLDLPEDNARYAILKRALGALAPEVGTSRLSRWMGHRPSLPDLLPVIGSAPGESNLLFAFGHQHLGLTLSGVTAEIIDSLVKGETAPVDLAPFRIDRFGAARRRRA